jgi:ribosomal 50S subunit-recycling heat shock protein
LITVTSVHPAEVAFLDGILPHVGGESLLRLDKFLKVSRIIKRRTVAKEACDAGRVHIGGRVAKAGSRVKPGDVLTVDLGHRELVVRVEELRQNTPAKKADEMYEVVDEIYKRRL